MSTRLLTKYDSPTESSHVKDIQSKIKSTCRYRQVQKESSTEAIRLCSGLSDGLPGVIIDQFGPLLVITDYSSTLKPSEWLSVSSELFPTHHRWIKVRKADGFTYEGVENQEYLCTEDQHQFLVKPTQKHDMGLFLDTKSARQWLVRQAQNKKILNLFAYTCAFAVVGANAQAKLVTNIDPNEEYLNWGKRNAELNKIDYRNYLDTTQKYLPRHLRRLEAKSDEPYDIIITDPPAFLVGRGDDRLGRKIWPSMLAQMKASESPTLMLICNDRSFRQSRNWEDFLNQHLNQPKGHAQQNVVYKFTPLPQSKDVLGQNEKLAFSDPHYCPPIVTIAERMK